MKKWKVGLAALLMWVSFAPAVEAASDKFPEVAATRDYDDMLSDYPAYLQFVLATGKQVDPSAAKKLAGNYVRLRKHYPEGAAKFLRGLRFELVHKLEIMGEAPSRVTAQHPEMRRYVGSYLAQWTREADEYFYRSYSAAIARKE